MAIARSLLRSARPSHGPRHGPIHGAKGGLLALAVFLSSAVPQSPLSGIAFAEPPAIEQRAAAAAAPSREYLLFTGFPFPLGPFTERRTVETELVKDRVYSFEQEIRLSGISANIRSTVFRMRDNHLLVYNPVAPTQEFLQQLEALHSDGVSHILLGATPYEHKVFVPSFSRHFPAAKVWAVPDQWAWPLDLPGPLLGIDTKGSGGGDLVDTAGGSAAYAGAPDLTSEFEVKLLHPRRRLGLGYAANEAALLHKDTKTLALTDALVNVPSAPTRVYDEANLLAIGDNAERSSSLGSLILRAAGAVNWQGTGSKDIGQLWTSDAPGRQGSEAEQLQRGWERNVVLSLFFGPSPATIVDPKPTFQALEGRWVVAPVTDSLIYASDRVQPELARWVDDLARWDFRMIAPSHFDAREGTPEDLRAAFAPTLAKSRGGAATDPATPVTARPYNVDDVRLLDGIATELVKLKVI